MHKLCQMAIKATDQNEAGRGDRECQSRVEEDMALNRGDRRLQCKDKFEQRPEGGEGASLWLSRRKTFQAERIVDTQTLSRECDGWVGRSVWLTEMS